MDSQLRILGIELVDVFDRQEGLGHSIKLDRNALLFLRQQVQRVHIHISVDQDNAVLRRPDQFHQKAERIVDLPLEEHLLRGLLTGPNVFKHLLKLFVRLLLVFQLLQFHAADPFKQRSIAGDKPPHLNKSLHDLN